jgi:amidophosphoribosyltransferase
VRGSYSLAILTDNDHLIAVRDPWGNRPLSVAKIENGEDTEAYAVASETIAFPILQAKNLKEVEPGQIIDFSKEGVYSSYLLEEAKQRTCMMERVYSAYELSISHGLTNATVRKELGRTLAKNHPGSGTVVSDVPQSATVATLAYAHATGMEFERLILKDPNSVIRTFMAGEMGDRVKSVEAKFNISPDIAGKKVDVGDDSIVVGNTSKILARQAYLMGAEELHFKIYSAMIVNECNLGVTMTSSDGQLIAIDPETGRVRSSEEVATELKVDSVEYNTLKEMKDSLKNAGDDSKKYCYHCFGGVGLGRVTLRESVPSIREFSF